MKEINLKEHLNGIKEYVNESQIQLPVFFGVDKNGNTIIKDLKQSGNIIIAGATGSGKSMFIHTVLNTLMYLYSPSSIRFLLIDPKKVELFEYKGSSYLFSDILWSIEIEEYFAQLENLIQTDNNKSAYLLVCIDTFSDMIYYDSIRFEKLISQISGMNNVFLILSDSRVASNVFTPSLMKLFNTKLLMKTASDSDSRVFSDSEVGTSLNGRGDSLIYFSTEQNPIRVQCPYINYDDINKLSSSI